MIPLLYPVIGWMRSLYIKGTLGNGQGKTNPRRLTAFSV
jgi:hypothetical protein